MKRPSSGCRGAKVEERVSTFPRWEYITLFWVIFKRKLHTLDDFLTLINRSMEILCAQSTDT